MKDDHERKFPERVTLDHCIDCGWLTTGAWMQGPCPVCESEHYEACEYVPAPPLGPDSGSDHG